MSDTGVSVDSYDVKSKIASFEAFNETLRSEGSPDRRSGLGVSPKSSSNTASLSQQDPRPMPVEGEPQHHQESTTTLASQNRKSRLQRARQNQPEPGSLMQKRLSAKERRLATLQVQQQKQQEPHNNTRQISHQDRQLSSRQVSSQPRRLAKAPSSVSTTRAPTSSMHPQSTGSGAKNSNLALSPNMKVATAAARQHRASNYSSNHNAQRQQQQQQQQQMQQLSINGSSGSSGEQDISMATGTSSKAPLSRFHKLKMKGMDHAKLAMKRKQDAAQPSNTLDNRERNDAEQHQKPSSSTSSQAKQRQQRQRPAQRKQQSSPPQPKSSTPQIPEGSPDQPLTDDDATLTSVARLFDDSRNSQALKVTGDQAPSNQSVGIKPLPRLWSVGEEKSEKAIPYSPNHNAGIYPRPSSSSEFEPEPRHAYPRNHHSPYAMTKGSASVSPQRPQLQQSHQQQQHHDQYHKSYNQFEHDGGNTNYHASRSPSHQPPQQQYSSPQAVMMMSPQERVGNGGFVRRSAGSYPMHNSHQQFYQSASATRLDDDERTFDYGVKDDDSQASTTFQQQLLEAERKAHEQSHMSEGSTNVSLQSESASRRNCRDESLSPLLKTEDPMEQYRQSFESPVMKTAAGVVGAATLGCILIGPVGLLLGAAAVGIGVGVMQIPEEQRSNMAEKATEAMSKVQEQVLNASEVLSTSCATTYKDSGIADHIPAEMSKFCAVSEDDVDPVNTIAPDIKSQDSEAVRLDQVTGTCGGGVVGSSDLPKLKNHDARKPASPSQSRSMRSKKVACLRHGMSCSSSVLSVSGFRTDHFKLFAARCVIVRIVPVYQIHGLDPSSQPRAWLDVLASADTSNDEKTEAMEEILILAKDKQRARIFLEVGLSVFLIFCRVTAYLRFPDPNVRSQEGILDSIMWMLSRYFEKLNKKQTDQWANPEITIEEKNAATLAATCCVTLGKAHCAAIHTEGDLLLMSMYERGTVPEERQLAQMLYEVPHHARITKTIDPTVVDPSMEVFALKQLTLPQAEDLAKSVKELADTR
jgi:hypothetical protein